MKKEMCDFCEKNETKGVYATDYAPVSLGYCEECHEIPNLRPLFIAIFGWGRIGDKYFKESFVLDDKVYPPMTYYQGKYLTVEEMVSKLTEKKIKKLITNEHIQNVVLNRFNNADVA
jgi:hypothetical protein